MAMLRDVTRPLTRELTHSPFDGPWGDDVPDNAILTADGEPILSADGEYICHVES